MKGKIGRNQVPADLILGVLSAAVSLFFNGLGVFLTIRADIGAGPWDVFCLGVSRTLGILYGNASIAICVIILIIDILLKEPIGLAMIVDSIVVGKSVDLFRSLDIIPVPRTLPGGIAMMLAGLVIEGYTQYFYMRTALGCGPRDTLLVGLKKRCRRIPIGVVSIGILSAVTLVGWLLGGPVGIGTILCAFASGPVMQAAFQSMHFDAAEIRHQDILTSLKIFSKRS